MSSQRWGIPAPLKRQQKYTPSFTDSTDKNESHSLRPFSLTSLSLPSAAHTVSHTVVWSCFPCLWTEMLDILTCLKPSEILGPF